MSARNLIPSYDLYKTLDTDLRFEFSLLEESYHPYDASLPHRHNYYEVLMFKESGGTHEIDFTAYPIKENSLHFISPEQVHVLRREKHVSGYVLSFTKDFFLDETTDSSFIDSFPFFNNPYAYPVADFSKPELQRQLFDILSKIQNEYLSKGDDKKELLLPYLNIFLILAKRIHPPETAGKLFQLRSEYTQKFKKLVEKNFRQKKSVAEYAEMLNITSGHLNDTVQKDTGKTASEIIHERIVLEAKRLLYHSPKSVKEIAYDLLYDDPSYFARFFKTHTQLTPEQFRKHIREKYH